MSRLASLAAWLLGSGASALAFWYVVVYLLHEFDRGYGRDTWFWLRLYLFALSVLIGLVGYGVASLFRARPRCLAGACVAGMAFTAVELLFMFVLSLAFPDRDVVAQRLAGALVIGALSVFLVRSNAA